MTFAVFESSAATCYYQSNHSKVVAIPLSALPKDTTSELAGLSPHYPFSMLKAKLGSCEYKFLKRKIPTSQYALSKDATMWATWEGVEPRSRVVSVVRRHSVQRC